MVRVMYSTVVQVTVTGTVLYSTVLTSLFFFYPICVRRYTKDAEYSHGSCPAVRHSVQYSTVRTVRFCGCTVYSMYMYSTVLESVQYHGLLNITVLFLPVKKSNTDSSP